MAFKLKSGNSTNFKGMGSSPAKDMKTGSYEHSFESPAKQTEEVVSKTSPGPGWTKTPGTNIWAPPKGTLRPSNISLGKKLGLKRKGMSISDFDDTISR